MALPHSPVRPPGRGPLRTTSTALPAALAAGAAEHPAVRVTFHGAGQGPGGKREVTVAEIHEQALRVAAGLAALGVRSGDAVAVQLPCSFQAVVAQAAVLLRGAVLLPLSPALGPAESRFLLRESAASVLITAAWRSHDVLRLRDTDAGARALRHVVAVGDTWPAAPVPTDAVDWFTLERFRPLSVDPDADAEQPCLIAYVSPDGDSPPRPVHHTHRSLLEEAATLQADQRFARRPVHLEPQVSGAVAALVTLLRVMVHGLPTVLMERWDVAAALELIHDYGVTSSTGQHSHLSALLDSLERAGSGAGTLGDYVLEGGAGVQSGLVERADRLGLVARRAYGLVEQPTVTAGLPSDPLSKRAETEGRPMPGNQVRVVDAAGRPLAAGQSGEIQTRGPDLCAGDRLQLARQDGLTPDGWLRTGDVGQLDSEGYLTVKESGRRRAPEHVGRAPVPGVGSGRAAHQSSSRTVALAKPPPSHIV